MKKKKAGAVEREKLSRKECESELKKLQVELCYLQGRVKATGARVVLAFEGIACGREWPDRFGLPAQRRRGDGISTRVD